MSGVQGRRALLQTTVLSTTSATRPGGRAFEVPGGRGECPDDRVLSRLGYERRVAEQALLEGGQVAARVRAIGARLRKHGVAADLLGIPEKTAEELVAEWERLAEAYPRAAELWRSVGPDVTMDRLLSSQWLGYRSGDMLWNPGPLTLERIALLGWLRWLAQTGDHPAGCHTLAAIACHEFGHAAEDAVRAALGRRAWACLQESLEACGIPGYAEERKPECFAVAFAALHHGDDDSPGVLRAVALVDEALTHVRR